MEDECEIILANKLLVGFNKVATPLCTGCANAGCSNPIVDKKISVFGKVMSTRLYQTGGSTFMVVKCEGYQPMHQEDEELDK